MINFLPNDLLYYLAEFLTKLEFNRLVNTSPCFQLLKYNGFFWRLNPSATHECITNGRAMSHVLSLMNSPQRQLSLNISIPQFLICFCPKKWKCFKALITNSFSYLPLAVFSNLLQNFSYLLILELVGFPWEDVHSLPFPKTLRAVKLRKCDKIERIRHFPHYITAVQIVDCLFIRDLKGLAHCRSVYVNNCPRITDLAPLKKVKELTIILCESLQHLTGLGEVPILIIHSCSRLRDISALQKNEKVSIYNCPRVLEGTNDLGQGKTIIVGSLDFYKTSLRLLHNYREIHLNDVGYPVSANEPNLAVLVLEEHQFETLKLTSSRSVCIRITNNAHVTRMLISNSKNIIVEVNHNSSLTFLEIESSESVEIRTMPPENTDKEAEKEEISSDKNEMALITHIRLFNCDRIAHCLRGLVRFYEAIRCESLNFAMQQRNLRQKVESMTLINCRKFSRFTRLNGIHELSIRDCHELRKIEDLKTVQNLLIENCENLSSLKGITPDTSVVIRNCPNLT